MKKRKIGQLEVSAIGLGCMGMSEFYGKSDEQEAINLINSAIDRGVTFFDTSDMYGPFTNEKLLGAAVKGRRHEVVLATKFGVERSEDGSYRGLRGDKDYIKKACEASLKRLNVDYIDLYYQHRVDPKVPIEETVEALAELVREGKIRHIGLCEAAPETIRRAHSIHPLTALQTEYSLWAREPEKELLPTVRELGIGYVAYCPLGRGYLTGKIKSVDSLEDNDFRRSDPRFKENNFQHNQQIVECIEEMAATKKITPAQLSLAWLLSQGDDIVPIPGTRRLKYLEENIAAVDVELTDSDLKYIDEVMPPVAGDRYSDMSGVNR